MSHLFDAVFVNVIAVELTPRWCFFGGRGGLGAFETLDFQHKSQPVSVSYRQPLCGCRASVITPTSNCDGRQFNRLFSRWQSDASNLHSVMSHPSLLREADPRALALSNGCSLLVCLLNCNLGYFSCVICRCLKKTASGCRSRARSQSSAGLQVN